MPSATEGAVVGLDIGTTSTIAIVMTPSGEVLASASRPATLSSPEPGFEVSVAPVFVPVPEFHLTLLDSDSRKKQTKPVDSLDSAASPSRVAGHGHERPQRGRTEGMNATWSWGDLLSD